jgi:hypothetical protein
MTVYALVMIHAWGFFIQEPPKPVPTYESSREHLKPGDSALVDRAVADICSENELYIRDAQHSQDSILSEARRRCGT